MFLSNIKLWNFRQFGSDEEFDLEKPHLNLPLKAGLNVLIGENDSGKTAIVDAIKLVLGTHSFEWTRVKDEDFYRETKRLRIELNFEFSNPAEAKNFTEWAGWVGAENRPNHSYESTMTLRGILRGIFPADVKAGADDEGSTMSAEARDYLKVTYLKPLRDAVAELVQGEIQGLRKFFKGTKLLEVKSKTTISCACSVCSTNPWKDISRPRTLTTSLDGGQQRKGPEG